MVLWGSAGRLRSGSKKSLPALYMWLEYSVASRSYHRARPGPSISGHLHLHPWGPLRSGALHLLSAASLGSPSLFHPRRLSGLPRWSCLGQNQHCSNDSLRSLQGEGPAPWPTRSPDPSSSGSQQQPGYTWPQLRSRPYRGNRLQSRLGNTSVRLWGSAHT